MASAGTTGNYRAAAAYAAGARLGPVNTSQTYEAQTHQGNGGSMQMGGVGP